MNSKERIYKLKRRSFPYIIVMGIVAFALLFFNTQLTKKLNPEQGLVLTADSLIFKDDSSQVVKINFFKTTTDSLLQKMLLGQLLNKSQADLKELNDSAHSFLTQKIKFNQEYPGSIIGEWTQNVKQRVLFQSPDWLTVQTDIDGYTGGAHGYFQTNLLNYDLETRQSVKLKAVIADTTAFLRLLEGKLRTKYQIEDSQKLNTLIFGDSLTMPITWGREGDSLTVLYNQYEIACYAVGQIQLKVGMNELAKMLSTPYQKRFVK